MSTRMRFLQACFMLFIYLFGNIPKSYGFLYVVKEKDKLSKIAGKYYPGPVWGKMGSFKKILANNPHISNIHRIKPGDTLLLPDRIQSDLPITAGRKPASEITTSDQSYNRMEVEPFFSNLDLSSRDISNGGTSKLSSSVVLGASLQYTQHWNNEVSSNLHLKLQSINFNQSIDRRKSITERSHFFGTIGIGIEKQFTSKLSLGLETGLEKTLFLRGTSTSTATLDEISSPYTSLSFSYRLAKMNAFQLKLRGLIGYSFPSSNEVYEVKAGTQFGAGFSAKQNKPRDDGFEVGAIASVLNQNTSITTQSITTYQLSFRFFFDFAEPHETH